MSESIGYKTRSFSREIGTSKKATPLGQLFRGKNPSTDGEQFEQPRLVEKEEFDADELTGPQMAVGERPCG